MSRELTPQEIAERSLIKTYRKSIWKPFIAAVERYELVSPGDHIAVCISGGKDSVVLAKLMQELQKHTDHPFELMAGQLKQAAAMGNIQNFFRGVLLDDTGGNVFHSTCLL